MPDVNIAILDANAASQNIAERLVGTNNRGVIVVGDPSVADGVAFVRAADPVSNDAGLVVRDVNTSAIVAKLTSGVTVTPGTGTFIVGFDPGHTLGRVNISDPTILGNVSPVQATDPNSNAFGLVVRDVNTSAIVAKLGHTMAVYFDQGYPAVNIYATAVIGNAGGSVAGTANGVTVSGNTIVSPTANYNIKVYAFSLTTTAQSNVKAQFTQGSGASPTVIWQVGLQAPTQGIAGANLAVSPPGYLFAPGVGNTLSLVLDTGSLVHYSVSYFKESS